MRIAWILALCAGLLVSTRARAGERFVANPKLTVECQSTLVKASATFVQQKLKLLDKCTSAAFKCIQTTKPDEDAEEDPIDVCLEKASLKCEKVVEAITAAEQALTDAITEACSALDPTEMLRADAMGYVALVDTCSDLGFDLTDLASVEECVVFEHECAAELMFETEHPRAGELLGLVGVDLGPDSCLEDFGGAGFGVEDLKLGKQLDSCRAGIRKAGAGFVGKKVKNLGQCLSALFNCNQLAFTDPECIAKAQKTCDKAFAVIGGEALKLEGGVDKSCSEVDFSRATPDDGLQFEALVDTCDTLGVSDILTLDHYKTCLDRQHECAGDELLKFTVPRAEELLALVGRTLPGSFFCPTEDDEDF